MITNVESFLSGSNIQELYQLYKNNMVTAKQLGNYRDEVLLQSPQGSTVTVDGKKTVMLAANNYLGLANHPRIVAATHKAIDDYGYGMASVPVLSGTQTIHKQLEERIAKFVGCENALLFNSCFMANTGVFQALINIPSMAPDYDYTDNIYSDVCNHPSVDYGIKIALSGTTKARYLTYKNNDITQLTNLLEASQTGRNRFSLIVTSSMFYTEGELAQLNSLLKLRDKYQALLYVDDSHGTGVLGATGRGLAEEQGVLGKPDFIVGTFGKALGGANGGFIAGKRDTIDYLRQKTVTYTNSNAIPPPVVCASLEALNILEEDNSLINRLHENTNYFKTAIKNLGFSVSKSSHPAIIIMIGEDELAMRASKELLHAGVYCREIRQPMVPAGKARLRAQVSAAHSKEELDLALEAFATVGKKLKLIA